MLYVQQLRALYYELVRYLHVLVASYRYYSIVLLVHVCIVDTAVLDLATAVVLVQLYCTRSS